MLFVILSIVIVVYLCIEFEFVRKLVAKLFFGTLAVALLAYGACAVQNAARAEELLQDFYYRVVFVDKVEELEDELVIHTDDLNHLWDYYEDGEEIDFNNSGFLNELAKTFAKENGLWYAKETKNPIIRGRIVVLTMWECDPNDPFDEEIIGVYYSKYITD